MKLIDEPKSAWKLFSVQIGALAVVWGTLPIETQTAILEIVGVPQERIAAILGVAVILARLVSQQKEG